MTTTDDRLVFVDTNVLVHATVATAPHHDEARAALSRLRRDKVELWVSRQMLREYASVLTRSQTYVAPVAPHTIVAQLRAFQTRFHIADETAQVTENLITLLETVPLGSRQVHDANIVATMQTYGISQLLTHNIKDFIRFSAHISVFSVSDIII